MWSQKGKDIMPWEFWKTRITKLLTIDRVCMQKMGGGTLQVRGREAFKHEHQGLAKAVKMCPPGSFL